MNHTGQSHHPLRICILDGSQGSDPMAKRIQQTLAPLLSGHQVDLFVMRKMEIAPCMGAFLCWTKKPGLCKNPDDNRLIAEAMIRGDLMLLLSPITFGGYSSLLKGGLDHLIQNISPFFTKIARETHHKRRYKRYPNLAVIGWTETPDAQQELIFRQLVGRNSINFYAEKTYCELFHAKSKDDEMTQKIKAVLEGAAPLLGKQAIQDISEMRRSETRNLQQIGKQSRIQKALLLVGSPRKKLSSSLSLGSYLCSQLQKHSIETETLSIYDKRDQRELEGVFAAIAEADLVILAFGLYVDSMPSPVIGFLEQLATYRKQEGFQSTRAAMLVGLANCGYPEASHNTVALAILEQFAKEAGLLWGGGIGLGGGNGLAGVRLEEEQFADLPIRKALDKGAIALAGGKPIPQEATDLAARQPYPAALFRLGAHFFWKGEAAKHGAKRKMRDRPYGPDRGL